jgi:tryptophan synthase beta chain
MSHVRNSYSQSYPDAEGYFGQFGGSHYPPEMKPALQELLSTYQELRQLPEFRRALDQCFQ